MDHHHDNMIHGIIGNILLTHGGIMLSIKNIVLVVLDAMMLNIVSYLIAELAACT